VISNIFNLMTFKIHGIFQCLLTFIKHVSTTYYPKSSVFASVLVMVARDLLVLVASESRAGWTMALVEVPSAKSLSVCDCWRVWQRWVER